MRTTLDIDEDVLLKVQERAGATGRSPGKIISELTRRAFALEFIEGLPKKNGFPQLPFDPSIKITAETIDAILDSIENDDDLGFPLKIDDATRRRIEQLASEQGVEPGEIAADLVQKSLLEHGAWPLSDGVALFPARGRTPLTLDEIEDLLDEL